MVTERSAVPSILCHTYGVSVDRVSASGTQCCSDSPGLSPTTTLVRSVESRADFKRCVSRCGWSQTGYWRTRYGFAKLNCFHATIVSDTITGNPMLIWMPALRRWTASRQIETPADRADSS